MLIPSVQNDSKNNLALNNTTRRRCLHAIPRCHRGASERVGGLVRKARRRNPAACFPLPSPRKEPPSTKVLEHLPHARKMSPAQKRHNSQAGERSATRNGRLKNWLTLESEVTGSTPQRSTLFRHNAQKRKPKNGHMPRGRGDSERSTRPRLSPDRSGVWSDQTKTKS